MLFALSTLIQPNEATSWIDENLYVALKHTLLVEPNLKIFKQIFLCFASVLHNFGSLTKI